MRTKSVYLAGPIAGLNYTNATHWREEAKAILSSSGIEAFSPMRAKDYLSAEEVLGSAPGQYEQFPMSTGSAILARDFNDCTKCDAVIMYLFGAQKVSIGSVMEVAWAHAARVPIVLVMEEQGNVHDHVLLVEACPIRVTSLKAALACVKSILLT